MAITQGQLPHSAESPPKTPSADSVRDISKWVESLIDSQINLICALLEAVSLGDAPGAVTRAEIGI